MCAGPLCAGEVCVESVELSFGGKALAADPFAGGCEGVGRQLVRPHAADLRGRDHARLFEDTEVLDDRGKKRGLLTYKSPLEVMVIVAFSSQCAEQEARWKEIARFYEDYKDWRVSFVAIYAGSPDAGEVFAKKFAKTYAEVPLLTEEERFLTKVLNVQSVPEIVILDESGDLRYRGPVGKDARKAIEAVIGHLEPVPEPEPPDPAGCPLRRRTESRSPRAPGRAAVPMAVMTRRAVAE